MTAVIRIKDSENEGTFEIEGIATLGRSPKNRIQLPDPAVSGKHCMIFYDENRGYVVRDLGSSNGTIVNKKRVEYEKILRDGDELILGMTRILFFGKITAEEDSEEDQKFLHSQIQSRITPLSLTKFLPEKKISDISILRADYEKLRITYELQRDIGSELDLDKILKRILTRTHEFLNFDRGIVLLFDENGKLELRAFKSRAKGSLPKISKTITQHIIKGKKGILSLDALLDKRLKNAESIIFEGVRSTMAVPVMNREELLGIIIVDSTQSTSPYTEKDLHLLTNIANQSAQFISNSRMSKKIESDAIMRERFQRLLSPSLAEMVVSGKLEVKKGGESKIATVLFADIRNFTAMSENMDAKELLKMLNAFFEVMVEIIFQHEGTVDKFMGDGVMVVWGVPVAHEDHAKRAVLAALDMQKALTQFNRQQVSRKKSPIQIGIGVNTGELVAGYMGSNRTMSYSVIGDTVNTASRLCSAAKPKQIVISEASHELVRDCVEVDMLEPITAKGKQKPIRAFNVLKILK